MNDTLFCHYVDVHSISIHCNCPQPARHALIHLSDNFRQVFSILSNGKQINFTLEQTKVLIYYCRKWKRLKNYNIIYHYSLTTLNSLQFSTHFICLFFFSISCLNRQHHFWVSCPKDQNRKNMLKGMILKCLKSYIYFGIRSSSKSRVVK